MFSTLVARIELKVHNYMVVKLTRLTSFSINLLLNQYFYWGFSLILSKKYDNYVRDKVMQFLSAKLDQKVIIRTDLFRTWYACNDN